MELCLETVSKKVTWDMNEQLLKPCTFEEVSEAVGHMADFKALGPYGLLAEFFRDSWNSTGQEVYSIVTDFFLTGRLEEEVNFTFISLIPKITSPTKDFQFRLFVIFSTKSFQRRWRSNRLKRILPVIILPTKVFLYQVD
jgi:hypothetical protein